MLRFISGQNKKIFYKANYSYSHASEYVTDYFKAQKMCSKVDFVSDYKTHKMCDEIVDTCSYVFDSGSNRYETQEMCDKAVNACLQL